MMVQARSNSNSKPFSCNDIDEEQQQQLHQQLQHKRSRFSRKPSDSSPPINISTWVSENLTKIILICVLAATVVAIIVLPNFSDTNALLCFEKSRSQSTDPSRIPFPQIKWSKIQSLAPSPSDPFAAFRADKWVVLSVSSHPTDTLGRLARIRGWQLLAVGDSRTPADWSLKGAIFLSLEAQVRLGYRILDFLPYSSLSRKSVGYLFAIQHGARKIYDADDRADVIDSDIGKRFDVDLVGEASDHPVLLQYSHHDPNKTVVNPYIHFGQRSVWPRGLPLERVGDVSSEEFYTEVFSGRQFIQQGLSDGLPDVDSVFYFTRKSSLLEAFDIRFDHDAPKVALPQGTMVPVNCFNTLFHGPAFWGLMLPVSVSNMASDIIRGYWTQRILWEIGGFVTVYPPTVHRVDRAETYPFAEEKDLHVNVGRLINFLVNWRSKKPTLFERILHLSYVMAEEGFWTEKDVRLTAAWLQDLISVGYQQPRLMALELDRPRASIGHGDRREFIPKRLPSVHLGVEEIGTVNYEIGNLIRWRKNFGNVVLVMFCSSPVDRTALEWRLLYGRIFKTVVILSEQNNTNLAVDFGQLFQAYKYLPKIFDRFAGADGFLFLQDDMILNYWNIMQADKTKLWITNKVPHSWVTVLIDGNSTEWLSKQHALVKQVVGNLPVHFQLNYKDSLSENKLTICGSEIFYVPRHFVGDFADLVGHVGNLDIHHNVAVPMFFMSMDSPQNFDNDALAKIIYWRKMSANETALSHYFAEVPAVYPLQIKDELDFVKLVRVMAAGDPLLMELV